MQLLGVLLVIWGIVDFAMATGGTDIYYDWLGIYLPDWLYSWSPWLAGVLGMFLIGAGNQSAKK